LHELEQKSLNLHASNDRLNEALGRSEESENMYKSKIVIISQTLSDNSSLIGELQDRIAQLQRAVIGGEQEKKAVQERHEAARQGLAEAKKQNHALLERLQALQNDLTDSEARRNELGQEIKHAHLTLAERQAAEDDLNQKVSKLSSEKQSLQDALALLQRNLANLETQKSDAEKALYRLEKDKNAILKTLDKVERAKLLNEELLSKSVDRSSLDKTLQGLNAENQELQKQIKALQADLARAEHEHSQRLNDLTNRFRQETDAEMRAVQSQAEKQLEARDRANKHRIKGMEEQIEMLKDQLEKEIRKRQLFLSRSGHLLSEDVLEVRKALADSGALEKLAAARKLDIDPMMIERENKKLDEYAEDIKTGVARMRSPVRAGSPLRSTYTSGSSFQRASSQSRVPLRSSIRK